MRRVLIPTDFSENSKNAVRYAFEIFKHDADTEYTLLNAYDLPRRPTSGMLVSITDILKKDSVEGLKKMVSEIQQIGHTGEIRTEAKHGRLCNVILDLLEREEHHARVHCDAYGWVHRGVG